MADMTDGTTQRSILITGATGLRLEPYLVYPRGEPVFCCDARNGLASAREPMPLDEAYLTRLIDYCRQTEWGVRLEFSR